MAQIKLIFKPDLSEVKTAIQSIKKDISGSLGNIKLGFDSGGAQAAQSFAANLQKVASAADEVSNTIRKTETYVDGALTQETELLKKATGEYKRYVTEHTKDGEILTETVIHNEEEKRKAQEKTQKEAEQRRQREQVEAEKHRQAQIKRDEQWARDELRYEQETAKQIEGIHQQQRNTWKDFVKEQADYKAQQEELVAQRAAEANRQMILDEEEAQRKRTAAWKAHFDEINGLSDQKTKQGIEDNRRAVLDEEEAQRKRTAAWKAYFDEINAGIAQREKAADSVDALRKGYANLLLQIENLKAKYPEGTFDAIERKAREAGNEVRNLDVNSKNLVGDVDRLSGTYKKLTADLAQTRSEHQAEANAMKENTAASALLNNSLGSMILQSMTIRAIIRKTVAAFREALRTMKEVDSELVTIQKTTGYSGEQLDRLTDSAYKLASAYGRTATEILSAASVYARAGFKENLEDMTELSALLQNVGDLTGEAAAKFLVATNAAWRLNGSYESLLGIIDGLNQQTNEAAVDMEALTSGITVAGSVFSNAGESVQTFAGMLGAGVALTQRSGSEIGRGLRTIAMNIRQIKGELDNGEIIDEASISDAAAALHSVGISVADANGELRLTSEVLTELAGKWGRLTTAEQSYLSQSLAGKRQANILNALMNNWQEVERQMTLYANGAGSALKENEIYLDSWDAKTKQLSAAWTEFVANLVDTDVIKGALDRLIALVNLLDSGFGHFLVTAAAIPTVILTLATAVSKLAGAFNILKNAMIAHPVLAAGAITAAGAVAMYNALTTTAEEYQQATKEATQEEENLLREIAELESREENLTELEREKLDLLKQQVVEARKQKELAAYQQYNDKYGPSAASLNPALDEVNQLISQYQYRSQQARNESDPSKKLGLIGASEDAIRKLREMKTELEEYSELMGGKFPEDGRRALDTISNFLWYLDEGTAAVEAGRKGLRQVSEELDDAGNEAEETVHPFKTLSDTLKDNSEKATSFDTVIGAVITAMQDFGAESYEVNQAMKNLETIMPGSTAKMYDFDTATVLAGDDIFTSKEAMLDFIDSSKQLEFTQAISELEALAAGYWDVAGAALAAMANQQAAAQMAGVLAFTTGSNPQTASAKAQLADLQRQKAEWDAYIATLRQRSDYRAPDAGSRDSQDSDQREREAEAVDQELEDLRSIVELRKTELSFLKESGKGEEELNAKRREIQEALHRQAEHMRASLALMNEANSTEAERKSCEADILSLSTEWWSLQKDILEAEKKELETRQALFDLLKKSIDEYYDRAVTDKERELTLEEKLLAVRQAEDALEKAKEQRTVRYWNASAGKWEWTYDRKTVQAAEESLKNAQKELADFQREQAWKEFRESWEYVAQQLREGSVTFGEAYEYMAGEMKRLQGRYNVNFAMVLEDSIGKFHGLNATVRDLTEEMAEELRSGIGLLHEELENYNAAVEELYNAFRSAGEAVRSGELTMEEAFGYLRDKAAEISERYGQDMSRALEEAVGLIAGVGGSIEELWTQTVLNLISENNARAVGAGAAERDLLDQENGHLAGLVGGSYDPNSGGVSFGAGGGQTAAGGRTGTGGSAGGTYDGSGGVGSKVALSTASTAQELSALREMEEAYRTGDTATRWAIENQLRANGAFISTTVDGKPSGILYSVSGHSNGSAVVVLGGENVSGVDPGTLLIDGAGNYWRVAENGKDVTADGGSYASWYEQAMEAGRLDYSRSSAAMTPELFSEYLRAAVANGKLDAAAMTAYASGKIGMEDIMASPAWKELYAFDEGGILRGLGGIKATAQDEMVLNPKLTAKVLDMANSRLSATAQDRLEGLLDAATLPAAYTDNRIGSQHNGNIYQFGGVTLTEGTAKSTSVYDLAHMARGLGSYNQGN